MKNRMAWVWLLAFMALPAAAQDETAPAAEAAPAAEEAAPPAEEAAAPAEESAADTTSADSGSGAEASSDASAAEAITGGDSADEAASDTAASDAAPAEDTASSDDSGDSSGDSDSGDGEGLKLYVGLEYDQTTIDINDDAKEAALGRHRFDSDFYKLRLGWRAFEAVAVEFHAGFPANKSSNDELETKQFYGLYLVPTGVLLNTIEVSARLGYAYTEVKADGGAKEDQDGASFGIAFELPLRLFGESMPNLRIGAGGTVYQEERESRIFGWHGGIRYDFTL